MDYPPPKRPRSAYLFFSQARRLEIKEAHPEATGSQIVQLLASAWNKLSETDREPFQALARQDRARFERQKQEFLQEGKYYNEAGVLVVRRLKKRGSQPSTLTTRKKHS